MADIDNVHRALLDLEHELDSFESVARVVAASGAATAEAVGAAKLLSNRIADVSVAVDALCHRADRSISKLEDVDLNSITDATESVRSELGRVISQLDKLGKEVALAVKTKWDETKEALRTLYDDTNRDLRTLNSGLQTVQSRIESLERQFGERIESLERVYEKRLRNLELQFGKKLENISGNLDELSTQMNSNKQNILGAVLVVGFLTVIGAILGVIFKLKA